MRGIYGEIFLINNNGTTKKNISRSQQRRIERKNCFSRSVAKEKSFVAEIFTRSEAFHVVSEREFLPVFHRVE